MFEFLNRRKRRWSDINYHWGPFTYSPSDYPSLTLKFTTSGDSDDTGSYIRFQVYKWVFLMEAPNFIEPHKRWVDTSHYEWANGENSGYWDIKSKEYGFSFFADSMHWSWCRAAMDSWPSEFPGSKSGVWSYPFSEWDLVRKSWYRPDGSHFATLWEDPKFHCAWEATQAIEDALQKIQYEIVDYDGEQNIATCHIEEWEWHRGARSFKWLKYFTKPLIKRAVKIRLQKELGPEKGSWKGGIMGTSINMLPGESIDDTFNRWCDQEHPGKYKNYHVKFVRKIEPEPKEVLDEQSECAV